MTTHCAVLGSPIGHSLSPVLHRAAYAELGLDDWRYSAQEVREDDLAAFLAGLDESWRGLSLTMPLKRAVVPLLDEMSERAAQARAANTVVLDRGRLLGHNTDVPGAVQAIGERHQGRVGSAVIVGGGATASSTLLALADLGCSSLRMVVRDPSRVGETLDAAARHPVRPMVEVLTLAEVSRSPEALRPDVLVSTVPAQAQGEGVLRVARNAGLVFDVVYDPWPTPLARLAQDSGIPFVSGLDLLVQQAALQVRLMTGCRDVPVAAMRAAGLAALGDRTG